MSMIEAESPSKTGSPLQVVSYQIDAMQDQLAAVLPEHIPVKRFVRFAMTAVNNNPELMECDRRSLLTAILRAAQDGLRPDGREGVIVVRYDKKSATKKSAAWQPMIEGIRKKARNSGEIATWEVEAVFSNDHFEFEKGDNAFILHRPTLGESGQLIAAYSICTLKSGEKSRDVMSAREIFEVRDRYSDGWKAFKGGFIKSTPWDSSPAEMAKKTVARRHAKVLPMSTDLEAIVRRDDELHSPEPIAPARQANAPRALADKLNALAGIAPAEHEPAAPEPVTAEDTATPAQAASGDVDATEKGAPADSAEKPLSPEASPALDAQATALLADLIETGNARAQGGASALREFLDGLEARERKLIPDAMVTAWIKAAKAGKVGA